MTSIAKYVSLDLLRDAVGEEQFTDIMDRVAALKASRAAERSAALRQKKAEKREALAAKQRAHEERMAAVIAERAERLQVVADLRKQGCSYKEIGAALGLKSDAGTPMSASSVGAMLSKVREAADASRGISGIDPFDCEDVEDSEMPVRVKNCLRSCNIQTFAELTAWSAEELLRAPSFGSRSLNEVREELAMRGLALKPS
jgi:DNA-binding transcriptional MerR regulator